MAPLLVVWAAVLLFGLAYSARFSYRDFAGRPIAFVRTIWRTRIREKLLAITVAVLTLYQQRLVVAAAVVTVSFVAPTIVRQVAYRAEVGRHARELRQTAETEFHNLAADPSLQSKAQDWERYLQSDFIENARHFVDEDITQDYKIL